MSSKSFRDFFACKDERKLRYPQGWKGLAEDEANLKIEQFGVD
jgi:hypothetical protein